jgi:hypothetical protein
MPEVTDNVQYVFVLNQEYSSLPRDISMKRFDLVSFISFESLFYDTLKDVSINHYVTVGNAPEHLFILDDLLLLRPGGFQGSFLEKSDERTKKFFTEVPLCVFKRSKED